MKDNYNHEFLKNDMRNEAYEFIKVPESAFGDCTLSMMWIRAAKRMSAYGGMIRNRKDLKIALDTTNEELTNYLKLIEKPTVNQLPLFYRLRDMLISQKCISQLCLIICKVEQGAEALRCIRMIEGENPITVSLICINAGLTGEHMQELFKKSHGKMVYVSQNGVRCAHS